jgi:hypothetical protein
MRTQNKTFCVGDSTNLTIVNGLVCKNPAEVKAKDFTFLWLDHPWKHQQPTPLEVM